MLIAKTPSPVEVRAALERMIAWRGFASSPRLARFLTTIVEWTLEGRSAELKESAIAVEVFDREPSYDPRTDPIVRVQAVRLRSKLIEYHASNAQDKVVIELPARGYVPVFRYRDVKAAAAPETSSIAVLPFVDMSPEQNMQYFCDGIAEEILHLLAKNPALQVVARTSSFAYKSKAEDVRRIGETLGAATILEGSVRLWGSRTRVTAQLTNARDGYHLWSATFDRELSDIFALQDEIAEAITRKLDPAGSPAAAMLSHQTGIEAYRLVLLGRHHFNRQTPPDFEKAQRYFQEALDSDPQCGPAWTGLALCHVFLAFFQVLPALDLAEPALRAAERGVELAPDSAEAHLAIGAVHAVLEQRLQASLAEYETAVGLDGSSSDALDFLTMALTCLGREAEALAAIARARELDPLSARIEENAAFTHFQFRHFETAAELYRKLLDREPFYFLGWLGLAWTGIATSRPEEALKHVDHVRGYTGNAPFLIGTYGLALARCGRRDEARELNGGPYEAALIAIGLEEHERAIESLERAAEERTGWMLFAGVNPLLDPLRGNARFDALCEKVKSR